MSILDDEEYKKRLERARQLRETIGFTTNFDTPNNSTSFSSDTEYQERLNRARELRNSVGMITDSDYNIPTIEEISENNTIQETVNEQKRTNQQKYNEDNIQNVKNNYADTITESQSAIETNIKDTSAKDTLKKDRYNFIVNGKKPENLMTEDELNQKEQEKQLELMANTDKNPLSQIGKIIENMWLGIASNAKAAVNYIADSQHTKKEEALLLAGKNDIVSEAYKWENINKNSPMNTNKTTTQVNKPSDANSILAIDKLNQNHKNNFLFDEKELQNKLTAKVDETRDIYGDIELNPLNRELSKSIAADQEKIATNALQIENPIMKKVAELAPSSGNSLFGAGISALNPYLGMTYFMISAAGMYEADGRSRGMSKDQAKKYGLLMGYAEGATEMLEISNLLKAGSSLRKGAVKEALKYYGLDMADNAIQEAVIDPIDEVASYVTSGKTKHDYSTRKGWEELGKDMVQDGIDGALSALLMNGIDVGINSVNNVYNKIKKGIKPTKSDYQKAYTDINNNPNIDVEQVIKESLEYEKNKIMNGKKEQLYSLIDFDGDQNVTGIKQVAGYPIEYNNDKVNITPAVIYTDGFYNIIDTETGLKLDTTQYNTQEEAIENFYNIMNNPSNTLVNSINTEITNAKLALAEKMQEVQTKIITDPEKAQVETSLEFVPSNDLYSAAETTDILNRFEIKEKIKNRPYLGQEINDIINNNLAENNQNENIGNFNNQTVNNTIENANGQNSENNANKTPEQSKFYEDKLNYAVSNVEDIEKAFNKKKIYTLDEVYETMQDVLEVTYDNTLDDDMYIDLEEKDGKLEAVLYDGRESDDIIDSIPEINRVEIVKNKNGKYTAEAINNAIKEAATMPNENSPIQGQVDIEGNIVNNQTQKRNTFEKEIESYNKKRKNNNQINGDVLELNINILDGISKKKQSSFMNEYLKNEVQGHDYYIYGQKIIATSVTVGKLKNGKTNFDKNIPQNIKNEIKANIIGNLDNFLSISQIYQPDRIDTKNHSFADTFDRRKSIVNYKGQNYEVMFEIGKKNGINTLYGIESVKKTNKNRLSLPNLASNNRGLNDTNKSVGSHKSKQSITQKNNSVKSTSQNSNIQDFGEKIGGARKDLSTGRTTNNPGKEVIHDYTVKNTDNGYAVNFKNKVLKDGFKTQAEAEQYILDFKNSIKDNRAFVREGTNRDGETSYMIFLRNPRTLKSQSVGKIFKNKQDAENYAMALSMYLKDNGKNLFRPQIQKVLRENANSKNANKATGEDILKNFGFKGGEFGNWVTQSERQQFLNYAQDAFTDLAAALDVTPDSLGQQGAMSIAFGARGKGLTGAVAHFEPAKKVINMTRLKGAGSLAHEFGHSIDNYISRVGGYDEDGMATTNLRNPKLSENMQKAVREVVDAMRYNVSTNQEEVDKKNAIYEKARKENLEYNLRYIDKVFNGDAHNYRRIKGKYEEIPIKVTAKQKTDYQKIRNTLMEGGLKGDIDYKMTDTRSLKAEKIYPEPINTLQKMYKEVVGRKIDDDTVYSIYRNGKPTRQVTEVKSESAYSKSALELDRETGRSAAYFSRIDEMWARAFESYISDKLKAKGIKDTYLVHSVNNNEYALFNPFPAGEERKNINKAFDNLIQIMKDEGYFTESEAPQNYDEDTGIRYMKTSKSNYDSRGNKLSPGQVRYFKDSKVRDEKGNLLVVYHGTNKGGFNIFNGGTWGVNYYTDNKQTAETYLSQNGSDNKIYEGYVNITKPLIIDAENRNWSEIWRESITDKDVLDLIDKDFNRKYSQYSTTDIVIAAKKSNKYDGVIFQNIYDHSNSAKKETVTDYVTFDSKQFKNLNNEKPTSNSDIRYMKKNKESKQSLASQFEKMTGDSITRASAKLAGIELRNMQRQNGNLAGDLEENPYSKEAMTIYNKYNNSKESSSYLYHSTPRENLQSIIENGLTIGNKQNQEGISSKDKIYLSTTEELAKSFTPNDSVTLRINPNFKLENLENDLLGGEGSYSITNNIPANMLQIKENGKWINLNNYTDYSDNNNQTSNIFKDYSTFYSKNSVDDKRFSKFFNEHKSDYDDWQNIAVESAKRDGKLTTDILNIDDNLVKLTTTKEGNKLYINELYVEKPKKGVGTKVVNMLKDYADKANLTIETDRELSTAKEFWDKTLNRNIKDNQGNTLSKQQQEYFANSKVRDENGKLMVLHHVTDKNFNVFDSNAYGKNTGEKLLGIYLSAEPIGIYGDVDMQVYANITNPVTKNDKNITKQQFMELLKGHSTESNAENAWRYFKDSNDLTILEKILSLYKHNREYINPQEFYDNVKRVTNYDGAIYDNYANDRISFVAFNSNQIKNIDNTNPTSNNDIRFAKRKAVDENLRNAERGESYIEQEIQKIEKTGDWDNSIPVTRLSDIRKTIEDYLGLGIKKGHFRQDAYAIYKGNNDVIRTKEYKDMDSILHETGHAMDLGKRLNVDKEAIADELLTAIDKLGGYEGETRTIRLEEGFAEVIREYSIIPEQAKKDYPQTIAVLEELRRTDKKFNDFITKVQQQSYNYIHQNPRNRTLSNLSIGEQTDKSNITKNLIKQEVMRNIYDKDFVVKSAVNELAKANGKTANQIKASENAYYLTRLASGKTDKVISMLSDGYVDENGKKLFPGLSQIGDILGNDPKRFNDLRAYLVARRDLDYKAKTLKTGIRTMDSKAVIQQFSNDKQIQKAAQLVYDTLDGIMQYAVNNGLISQESVEKIKQSNAFYVPMQRVLENKGNQIGRKGAVADIIKKRTGSELDVKDVLENIIVNSSNIIQQVENNNVLKAFYKEGQESGLTGAVYDVIDTPLVKIGTAQLATWENELKKQGVNTADLDLEKTIDLFAPNNKVDPQNLITSFVNENGKRVYLQFNDELLFNSLMNMDKKFMSQVLKINSKMNMPLRYGATMANLGFAIPNMISDTAQAAVYSTAGFIPVVDNALGVLDILAANNKTVRNFVNSVAPEYAKRINTLYSLYQQSGATNSSRMSQYRESTQNLMQDVYGTKSKTLGIKEKFKPLKRLLDILTYIPEISEQSTRFRVFEKNYNYYKRKGNTETDARILAALESRDATQDFGRTGNITREINQLIPFSAARVGSAYTFAEKIKANPKQVGLRIAVLTALALAIKGMGYDDDEIDELNRRKKDDNFVLRMGDNIVTIKKPQGILRSIINLTEYIEDLSTGHIEEGKEGERLEQWLNNAIMDNMPADEVTGLVPNAVAPIIENALNKDFYYNTDIVKSYDQDLPDSEQYYDYNSQLAIWLGKIFNYSPAKIDNLISGYFGGLGTSVTGAMDYVLGKAGAIPEKPEMGIEQNTIGKRFIVNVNTNSESIDEVYNRKTELTKLKNGGTITSAEEKELEKINSAISNMSDLNKQIKEIKKDLTMSGETKAEKIRVLQQEKTDTARQALGKTLIHPGNEAKIESTQFYPNTTLKKNGYTLTLNSQQQKEYEQYAADFYNKYKKQGLYNEEKLNDIKSKAKDYAKDQMFKKYRSDIVKTKK